ncbi:galectin-4-like [Anguilla anguilla]|uniref:galectin-4-like n=1 Tax=Anguilla anguilla TaxID=7936 RepID=UPI0015AF8F9F|nr:galectin-4-like [Anguilla anguilla]
MRINNPIIPYDGPIQGGLKPGMTVYFKGTVNHNITRFHINLQAHCDRTMHFNPRFKPEQVVVFNTFRHRRWECEERVQKVPFTPGESFEVLFAVTCEGYQVVVNGAPFYLFKHRIPVQRVTGLQIGGDVSMETVIIGEGGVQICPPPKQVLGGEMSKICSGHGPIMVSTNMLALNSTLAGTVMSAGFDGQI